MRIPPKIAAAALASVLLILGASSAARAAGTGWAVVVGIDRYDSDDITPLQCAEADARAVASTLTQAGSFPAGHVFVLTGRGRGKLRASRPDLVDWLVRLRGVVKPGDSFVFFFAGHGIEMDGQSFLLPVDAIPEPVENLQLSALNMGTLRALLEKIPARRMLIAVDACRSDPRAGRGSGDNRMSQKFARDLVLHKAAPAAAASPVDVVATLFACKVGQRSYEWTDQHHGFFSYFFVKGLRGAARDARGKVTLNSLVEYVQTRVPRETRIWKGAQVQNPWVEEAGTGAARWVLSSPSHALPQEETEAPEMTPPPTPTAPDTSALRSQAEAAFDAGRFALPPGDNVVELCRQAARIDRDAAWPKELEKRAAAAFENLGRLAQMQKDTAGAAKIYRRLFELYPERQDLLQQVAVLEKPPPPPVVGTWKWVVHSIFVPDRVAIIQADGSATLGDLTCHWVCSDPARREYSFPWSDGWTHVMVLSADGSTLEGHDNWGTTVIGTKQ